MALRVSGSAFRVSRGRQGYFPDMELPRLGPIRAAAAIENPISPKPAGLLPRNAEPETRNAERHPLPAQGQTAGNDNRRNQHRSYNDRRVYDFA
jgi:hypothetical protein